MCYDYTRLRERNFIIIDLKLTTARTHARKLVTLDQFSRLRTPRGRAFVGSQTDYSHLLSIWLARKWLVAAWNLRSINDKPVWHSQLISPFVEGSSLALGKVKFWALIHRFERILRRIDRVYLRMLLMSRIVGREDFFRRSAAFVRSWLWKAASSGRFLRAIEANPGISDVAILTTRYLEKSGEDVGDASRVWGK